MVPGTYRNGMLVIGIDYARDGSESVVFVKRLGPGTGDVTIEAIYPVRSFDTPRPLPPVLEEPEPPPQKKSWKQQQKELPKFLRPRKGRE